MMGMMENEHRLPLVPLSPEYEPRLKAVLHKLGLLETV
jgi:dihydrodipicolinate synthase/N-acetylneuraminate lyase